MPLGQRALAHADCHDHQENIETDFTKLKLAWLQGAGQYHLAWEINGDTEALADTVLLARNELSMAILFS